MSESDQARERHLPPIGQPDERPGPDEQADFAGEHEETAVDEDIVIGGDDEEREPESPRGWSGMEH